MNQLSLDQHESKVQNLFDNKASAWSDKYTAALRKRLTLFMDELHERCDAGARVLDFGCGSGIYLCELGRRGFRPLGIDLSKEMIAASRDNLDSAGVTAELHCGRLEDTVDRVGQFDAIICSSVLEYASDIDHTLKLLRQRLGPNGVLLLTIPNCDSKQRRREQRFQAVRPLLQPLSVIPKVRGYLHYLDVSINRLTACELALLARKSDFQLDHWSYFDPSSGRCDQTNQRGAAMLFGVMRKSES